MKAKEYVEKYCDKITSGDNSAMRELFFWIFLRRLSLFVNLAMFGLQKGRSR